MGVTVRQKPAGSGIWWVFVSEDGKRQSKRIGPDEKLAREVAEKLRAKMVLGEFNIGSQKREIRIPTFAEYSKTWLDNYGATAIKYSTLESYRNELRNHINPALGNKKLDEITRPDVKQFIYNGLKKGLSAATVRKHLAYLGNILTHAIDDEIIAVNPSAKLSKLIPRKDKRLDINPLDREELQIFLEKVGELYPRYFPFYLCAARTGMRLGELLGLEWASVDFHGRFIEVRQAFSRHRLTTPKNKRIRKVDMSLQLAETLRAHKAAMREDAVKRGEVLPSWVFTQANGKALTATNMANRLFHRCLERAGLRQVRFHDLRHSFASLLIQQGESLAYVKEQMGHHSIQITVDIYGHLSPEGNKSAVDRLDDAGCTLSAPSGRKALRGEGWSGRRASNPRPSAWKADALAN